MHSSSRKRLYVVLAVLSLLVLWLRVPIAVAWSIFSLPITWNLRSSTFLISRRLDNFDLTFTNYSATKATSLPEHPDVVPPILHHIALGHKPDAEQADWSTARNNCLAYHPGWEAHLWTDEKAAAFINEKFPLLKEMWDGYKYPIQRVDALRYLVLYEYGGVVLDMDLDCRRSLGPLRRFNFTAPAAHPVGFSNGFMMASKRHPFVGELVRNLPVYNWRWFGLPYPTVMFSTGCHYASTIHAQQKNRSDLRILSGTRRNPNLHALNGDVETPLFHHLGASSWHSFDAFLIVSIGKAGSHLLWVFVGLGTFVLVGSWYSMLQLRGVHGGISPFSRRRYSEDGLKRPEELIKCV
jgi:mannosyltransferase OCH1-like enzyme